MYVYRHIRLDKNEVFYVGIGDEKNYKRAYNKNKRNNLWKKIVNKCEFIVEIIADNLTKEDACELEELLIQEYGRIDLKSGTLSNLTNGGEFNKGKIVSQETRDKISKAKFGKKGHKHTIEFKNKKSESNKGNNYNTKKILKVDTNQIFDSISDVAIYFNLHNETVSRYLRGVRKNKLNIEYLDGKQPLLLKM